MSKGKAERSPGQMSPQSPVSELNQSTSEQYGTTPESLTDDAKRLVQKRRKSTGNYSGPMSPSHDK